MALSAEDIQRLFQQLRESLSIEELSAFQAELDDVEEKLTSSTVTIEQQTKAFKTLTESVNESKKAQKELNEEKERAKKVIKDFDDQIQKTIQTFTGVTAKSEGLIGSLFDLSKETDGGKKGFRQLTDTLKKTLTPFNITRSSVQKLAEASVTLSLANDKAIASFNGATGAGGRFNDQILALEKSNRRFGIGAAEAGASLQNLIGGLSGFGLMADETQTALADEVAELTKLGVAGSDTVGVFQSATKTFGMTTDAAMDLNQGAEALAQELGISLGQAVGDLNKALPQLAVLAGDEVEGAFKRLSEQAQETGLSIDSLTSISDRFMTFEQAGQAASNLNAVLGTQMFDTMGLLEAQLEGPQAFIDTFRDQLQGSVGDFDSLTVFQKQAIANAAGLSVVEVRNLMNAEALTDEQQEQARTREENLKTAMSLFDELQAVALQLTVSLAGPISAVKTILDVVGRILGFVGKLPGGLGAVAQVATITLLPSLIKTIVQLALQKTTLTEIGMKIQQNTMYQRMFNAEVARGNMASRGGMIPGAGNPGISGTISGTLPGGVSPAATSGVGGFLKSPMAIGIGGNLAGAGISALSKEEGDIADRAGGAISGAATGAALGSMIMPGVGTAIGGVLGGIAGLFHEGGQVGKDGEEVSAVLQKGEYVTKKSSVKAIGPEKMAIMNETGKVPSDSDPSLAAAINNLSTKMDSLMQRLGAPGDFVLTVDKKVFGKLTNEHFGAPGSSPISGVG